MEWNEKWLNKVHIQNFKSIKDCEFNPKRINVLIGEPNSGKSNVLEALSLLRPVCNDDHGFMSEAIRFTAIKQLFFDQNDTYTIRINSNLGFSELINTFYEDGQERFEWTGYSGEFKLEALSELIYQLKMNYYGEVITEFPEGRIKSWRNLPKTRYYRYKYLENYPSSASEHLTSPFGDNFYKLIEKFGIEIIEPSLYASLFEKGYMISLASEKSEVKFKTIKNGNTEITFPFLLLADTYRRLIFYYLAIATNHDAVLLFEEPEAHSFPPYITQFANWVLESETNQFFLATHSPYLLSQLLTSDKDDVAVFLTYLDPKDHSTKLHLVSPEGLDYIRQDVNSFPFNLERIAPEIDF